MKKGNTLLTKLAAIALGAVLTLGVGATLSTVSPLKEVEAATTQTDLRIYAYLEGAWDNNGHMFIHYLGGTSGTNWNSCPEMTKVVSDYWQGLFYYDVPIDTTTFLVKDSTGNVSKSSNQSVDITIASLRDGSNYKVAAVKSWVSDGAKREVTIADNAPGNSGQIAAILNHINSCSASYSVGYNAWPQLNDLFISPSSLDGNTVVIDNFGPETTISAKTAYLQARYTDDQASAGYTTHIENSSMLPVILIISLMGITSIAGFYLLSRKRKSAEF